VSPCLLTGPTFLSSNNNMMPMFIFLPTHLSMLRSKSLPLSSHHTLKTNHPPLIYHRALRISTFCRHHPRNQVPSVSPFPTVFRFAHTPSFWGIIHVAIPWHCNWAGNTMIPSSSTWRFTNNTSPATTHVDDGLTLSASTYSCASLAWPMSRFETNWTTWDTQHPHLFNCVRWLVYRNVTSLSVARTVQEYHPATWYLHPYNNPPPWRITITLSTSPMRDALW
jgi:hypothetical protein